MTMTNKLTALGVSMSLATAAPVFAAEPIETGDIGQYEVKVRHAGFDEITTVDGNTGSGWKLAASVSSVETILLIRAKAIIFSLDGFGGLDFLHRNLDRQLGPDTELVVTTSLDRFAMAGGVRAFFGLAPLGGRAFYAGIMGEAAFGAGIVSESVTTDNERDLDAFATVGAGLALHVRIDKDNSLLALTLAAVASHEESLIVSGRDDLGVYFSVVIGTD